MELHLKITGSFLVALALLHIIIPKYLNWSQELSPLRLVNKQIMHVHTFFIAFTVLLMGVLCLYSSEEIIQTTLGRQISLGLSLFWFIRLIFQFFVYSPELWKGKTFETIVHLTLAALWVYLSAVFFIIYLGQQ